MEMKKDYAKRWMATAVLTALLMVTTGARALGDPQVKDDLFAGADKFSHGASSSTEVNLDSKMLGMASKFGGNDKDSDLVKKLEFVIVLETGGWSHVVKVREAKESTDVCVKLDADGQFSELVVIAAEPQELTFVHLKGHMSLDQLMKAGAKYGVPESAEKKDKGAK